MTYILLDTSTPLAQLTVVIDGEQHEYEWEAGRTLAKGLLQFLIDSLATHERTLADLQGIGVFRGPGSFTGLRIGITVLNTIADAHSVAIVGANGDDWKNVAIDRLSRHENDQLVLPLYGAAARITTPRK